jgi:SNF2 family DNA or RNA helicase
MFLIEKDNYTLDISEIMDDINNDDESLNENQATIAAVNLVIFSVILVTKFVNSNETVQKWLENTGGWIFGRIVVDTKNSEIIIKGINYDKFKKRLAETYREKSMRSMFLEKPKLLSELMFNMRVIKKRKEMVIANIRIPLFFALELSVIFRDIYEATGLTFYQKLSAQLYRKTWISNLVDPKEYPINLQKLSEISPSFKLKPYQEEFVKQYNTIKFQSGLEGYILSFDQGLGKTLTSIALSLCLNKERVYIICPNTLKLNWSNELKKYITRYSDDAVFADEVFVEGVKGFNYNASKNKYVILNHESILKGKPFSDPSKDSMIIVDEFHFFRNMSGKRVGELIEFKNHVNSKDNLLMSGTPIKATPNEIIPALMMVDPSFSEKAAIVYNRIFNVDDIYTKNIVRERFSRIIYRKTKAEVLNLPKKHELTLNLHLKDYSKYLLVEVNKVVSERYKEILADKLLNQTELKREFEVYINRYSSSTTIEKFKYLSWINRTVVKGKYENRHDLTMTFLNTYNEVHVLPNIKNPVELDRYNYIYNEFIKASKSAMGLALGEILPKYRAEMYIALYEENKETIIKLITNHPKKTIIFSTMLPVINHIHNDLNKNDIGAIKIIGETKDRINLLSDFKDSDEFDVLCATSQTLSTGVTITEASQVLFFGTPWRSADYSQACDRVHRIGQTSEVYIYNTLLATSDDNLSTRMQDILKWSEKMFGSMIDNKDELTKYY